MRIGMRSSVVTAVLAVAIAFIAKDLTMPLLAVSVFGLFDRLIGEPLFGVRDR